MTGGDANRGGLDQVNGDKCIEELGKEVKLRYEGESGFQKAEEEKVRPDNRKRISNSLHSVRIKNKLKRKGSQEELSKGLSHFKYVQGFVLFQHSNEKRSEDQGDIILQLLS